MVHDAVIQHGIEVMHSPMVTDAVSFISAAPAMRALRETGHSIAHWLGDHFQPLGPAKVLPAHGDVPPSQVQEPAETGANEAWGGGRMVEFFAQSCPHCKHLEPIWKEATHKWSTDHPEDAVKWEQKECYGENWGEGRDHDECMKEGIHSFPTVRFFSKSGKKFADFSGDRTPENLIGFAAQHGARPERIAPLEETRQEQLALVDPSSPVKVVEYVAKSCPHCQSMEPIWNDLKAATASKKNILWEQKECFGKGWAPGKDLEECKKADIQGFPTIKFFGPNSTEEFHSGRSVSSILKWVEEHVAPKPPTPTPSTPSKPNLGDVKDVAEVQTVQAFAGPQLWAASLCAPGARPVRSKANFL